MWNILADELVLRIIRAQEEEDANAEDARCACSGDDGDASRGHASDLAQADELMQVRGERTEHVPAAPHPPGCAPRRAATPRAPRSPRSIRRRA